MGRVLIRGILIAVIMGASGAAYWLRDTEPSFDLAKTLSTEQYWVDSGLKFSQLGGLLETEKCYSDKTEFLACVNAVSSMAERVNLILTTSGKLEKVDPRSETTLSEKAKLSLWEKAFADSKHISFKNAASEILNLKIKPHDSILIALGINGFISVSKDPHSYYIPVRMFKEVIAQTENKGNALGFRIAKVSGKAIITKVNADSEASKSGLRVGDEVVSVNEVTFRKLPMTGISEFFKNQEVTEFKLITKRDGSKRALKMKRPSDLVKSVNFRILNGAARIGYIQIKKFAKGVCEQVESEIKTANSLDIQKLVLDLRDNPGGQIEQAACVAGLFLGEKKIFTLKFTDTSKESETAISHKAMVFKKPMITLVNASSASAAEILAGALQDYRRSAIVGERSFGKGSFQEGEIWNDNKKVAYFETKGLFYLPSGRTPQLVGIQPDIEIKTMASLDPIREETQYYSTLNSGKTELLSENEQQIKCDRLNSSSQSDSFIKISEEVFCGT